MSKVYTDPQHYTDIADAIREKKGVQDTYLPSEMPEAIRSIESGKIEPLSVYHNGTYNPTEDVNGYAPVTVAVPVSSEPFQFLGGIFTGYDTVAEITPGDFSFNRANASVKEILVDYSGEWNASTTWELGCRFTGYEYHTGDGSFCVFGTNRSGYYYDNPSLEINTNGNIWAGATTAASSWTMGLVSEITIPFFGADIYQVTFGWDGTKLYLNVYDLTTKETMGHAETAASSNPHPKNISNFCIGNNAKAGHFQFYGKIHLAGTYIRENGELVWGNDGSVVPPTAVYGTESRFRHNLLLWFDGVNNTGLNLPHDDSATVWADLSGHNHNGAINGGAVWGNRHLIFNGNDSWVNCGKLDLTVGTVEVAVIFHSIASTGEYNAVISNAQSGGFGIQQKNGKTNAALNISGGVGWKFLYGSTVRTGVLYVLTFSYDGSTMIFYENGIRKESIHVAGSITPPTNDTVLSIGSNPIGSAMGITPLSGTVFSIRIWNTALPYHAIAELSHDLTVRFQKI